MRKALLVFSFLLLSLFLKAQYYYPGYVYCADSSIIDPYYHCNDPIFDPVCAACIGKTFRNSCAADHWGGMATSHNYQSGVCGNFDIDFLPNPIVPGSADNDHGTLSIYTNTGPVTVLIQIFDVFGRQWFLSEVTINISPPVYSQDIFMYNYEQGLYYLFVTINGETQQTKIMKANIQ